MAKLYTSWILQREQQSRIGTYSSRSDVPPPLPEPKPLFSMNVATGYRDFVNNEAALTGLRKKVETAIARSRTSAEFVDRPPERIYNPVDHKVIAWLAAQLRS